MRLSSASLLVAAFSSTDLTAQLSFISLLVAAAAFSSTNLAALWAVVHHDQLAVSLLVAAAAFSSTDLAGWMSFWMRLSSLLVAAFWWRPSVQVLLHQSDSLATWLSFEFFSLLVVAFSYADLAAWLSLIF